jgi:ribonucleoside-diphosphate reductase alpha chain
MSLQVTKRGGEIEPLNIEKIHKVVIWATEGLQNVSASEVEIKAQIEFYDGIKTKDIHETLINATAKLISAETPDYQYVAGRLINYAIRKEVYGGYTPCRLYDLVVRNVGEGFYDDEILKLYTEEELDQIDSFIDHERDYKIVFAGMEQLRGKYLVQNRVTGALKESPQVVYALVAATLFGKYPPATRMGYVRDYYDAISLHKISLPTPIMAGVRTPDRQFSSCVLIEAGDSLNSIIAATGSVVKYVSQKAGIGIGAGRIRAEGSPVRGGKVAHTGVTPFLKLFNAAVGSCNQGGVRKGSATVWVPFWHREFDNIIVLKNNKGVEDTRIRTMDYGIQFNRLAYERLIDGGDLSLFCPNDVPALYEAFFADQDLFRALYEAAEANPLIPRKTVPALDLFSSFAQERKDTGRIYLQNVDNSNQHSPFDEKIWPIKQSNLCAEINLPTRALNFMDDPEGRIALCTLSAINWGAIEMSEMEHLCSLAVRALDALLDYQNYPMEAARLSTLDFRPLGIGVINLAYWLAKNGFRYSDDSSLEAVDEWMESMSYYLIKASIELAEEVGACSAWEQTKFAQGILPPDTRKPGVDALVPYVERLDWDDLRLRAAINGQRNATLMAAMPAETSAQVANATNGIEPPRALVSIKGSKHSFSAQVVPEIETLADAYELVWDQKSPMGYLNICAVMQKWMDQGMSVNTSYNPQFYPKEEIPLSELIGDILHFYKMGGKQLYYNNTNDSAGEVDTDKLMAMSDPIGDDEADCDSCKI